MASDERPQEAAKPGREPLPPSLRKRLDKVFEVASKKAAAAASSKDYDYPAELLAQCVAGDPGNATFVEAYLDNLHKKYGNPKKVGPLAQFKERGARGAVKKALAQEQWDEAIAQGLKVLAVNPWDMNALTGMATAAKESGDRDCELAYLKAALKGAPRDPACNRLFAVALADRGLIDQAIIFWHRVEEAQPDNEEAKRAIAVLTVEKARSTGKFDDEDDEASRTFRVKAQQQEEASLEQQLLQKIKREPKNIANYLELAQLYLKDERYAKAEEMLGQAFEVSDGDPDIREKWQDAQLRHLRQKIVATQDPAVKKKLEAQFFDKDLEVCKDRVERFPNDLRFKYDLGYRYMRAKRYAEAIRELQAAKNDPRRKGVCVLVLGQCFEQIKQYRLAMDHYESAIKDIPDREADNKKAALYRAGRLALAAKDLDHAEKHLTSLAGLDFTYKNVSELLDKIAQLRENPASGNLPPTSGDSPPT